MSSTMRIDYVEAALLQYISANLPITFGAPVSVDSLGDNDFNDDGTLVLSPPAVRVRFAGANFDPARDNQRLTYQARMPFEILCYQSSLRSKADERQQTLVLVGSVCEILAGARLSLSDGSATQPVTLKNVALVESESGPVDQLFSVGIEVSGIAQFSDKQ